MITSLRTHLAEVRAARHAPSEEDLTELLYQRWFIAWRAPVDLTHQASGDDRFVAELSAVAGDDTWFAPGWTVTARSGPRAFVTDDHVQLYVDASSELWPADPAVGAAVHLRMPCARACATPGFFLLVSRLGRAPEVHDKLYLHLTKAGGRAVIARLRTVNAKFEVKVANAPDAYGRRDSGVVYVDPASRKRVVRALLPLSAKPSLFRAEVPPMTKRLGRGLGLAEPDAVDGARPASFGEERCRIVARALLRSRAAGSLERYLPEALREAGLDPDAPWKRAT
jgi:hypothetical protein